ncbi:MAG: peptidoglycan D,D-transpeptidase FtsI family protein [Patescibacteria group bacterium]
MWRVWVVFSALALFFLIILGRLFYWQVVASDQLRLAAAAQYFIELTLPAQRGQILASDGKPLVMNESAYLIYANPKKIENLPLFVQKMVAVLRLDPGELNEQLSAPGRVWVPLAHKVEERVVSELKKLNLVGLGFEKEPKRYYPEASMAAHLLGFVGSDQNGRDKGYFGLEGYYDRELRGKEGSLVWEKSARGAPILVGEAKRFPAENGRDLKLWLDRTIQYLAARRLAEGIKKYGAREGNIVVLDPKTGGILAMASYPHYDPADFTLYDKELYKNPVVAASFEPGSTFKILVMAAALNERLLLPSTKIEETGPIQVGEYTIRTWDNKYRGSINMTEVLQHSSNVGMVDVARRLGKEKMLSYLRDFGFGNLTGVDLEEESAPQLRASGEWTEIDLATASFGQGIAVTPLQMVTAVASLANDGWLMEPHAVFQIKSAKGGTIEIKPKRVRQVVTPSTAKIATEMMVAAVEGGEAKWAKPRGYRIAGKTGTAQIPVAGHYDEKKTIASFVGFAPADNPRFVMLVTLREPTSSPWGSETAAPLFFSVARDIFNYWGIPPQ